LLQLQDYEVTKAMAHEAKREGKHPLLGTHNEEDDTSIDE
jgi:hypothetical protein